MTAPTPFPHARGGRALSPLAVAVLGLVAVLMILGVERYSAATASRLHARERDLDGLRRSLLLAHLHLEEELAGDLSGPQPADRALDEAEAARSRLAPPAAELAAALPATAGAWESLADAIAELRERAADRRLAARRGEPTAAGSQRESEYDRQVSEAIATVDRIAAAETVRSEAARRRASFVGAVVLAGWAALVVATAFALAAHERRRRAAERELREGERRLRQVQKMEAVGRLAGGLAHDVNNYLAAIRAHAELAAVRELPWPKLVEKMERIVATVVKASSLVERLLVFARRQPANPEVVDLNEVVEAFAAMIRGALDREVTLEVLPAPGLWPVAVDLSGIEQVLANLVVNAREATPPGGRIAISTANLAQGEGPAGAAGEWVLLRVADTGRGIPPELIEKVFEPFFTTKEATGGSGLGLATVYAVVEQAGGRVELDSAPGAGTTVRIFLPRAAGSGRAGGGPAASGRGERLLLVDDNAELAAAVRGHLEAQGYRVEVAGDPEAAWAAVAGAAEPFDLVIADVLLPGASGPELVARLRRKGPLPAVFMSGYTDRVALRTGPGRGEAFFLKKPFSAEGLARMVRSLLDARETGDGARGGGDVQSAR